MAERTATTVSLDMEIVRAAQEKVGIPAGMPMGAVLRGIVASVAGVDLADQLDHTPGRGSLTYRTRTGQQGAGARDRTAA